MDSERGFDPSQIEGTELKSEDSPETVEGEKSLAQLQREYARAWLDFSMADLAAKRALRKEIDHNWQVIENPEDTEIRDEHERIKQELAEAERKKGEATQKQSAAFDALYQACPKGQVKEVFNQAQERFAKEELTDRINQDPKGTLAAFEGDEKLFPIAKDTIAKSEEVKRRLGELPVNQEKPN